MNFSRDDYVRVYEYSTDEILNNLYGIINAKKIKTHPNMSEYVLRKTIALHELCQYSYRSKIRYLPDYVKMNSTIYKNGEYSSVKGLFPLWINGKCNVTKWDM